MTMGTMLMSATTLVAFVLLCSLPIGTRGDDTMPDCSEELLDLTSCLAFVTDQVPSPPQICCDSLESVVMKTPLCLCELVERGKNGTANSGLPPVNFTLVRQLPEDCGIQSEIKKEEIQCKVAARGAPVPSPSSPPGSAGSHIVLPPVFVLLVVTFISSCAPVSNWQLCSLPSVILKALEIHDSS